MTRFGDPKVHGDMMARAKEAGSSELLVARWFGRKYPKSVVAVPQKTYASQAGDWSQHIDAYDIIVIPAGITIDVKHHHKLTFTCEADFQYPQILIANKKTYDRTGGADMYVVLNPETTHAAIIDREQTRQTWFVKGFWNSYEKRYKDAYFLHPQHVTYWEEVPPDLRLEQPEPEQKHAFLKKVPWPTETPEDKRQRALWTSDNHRWTK